MIAVQALRAPRAPTKNCELQIIRMLGWISASFEEVNIQISGSFCSDSGRGGSSLHSGWYFYQVVGALSGCGINGQGAMHNICPYFQAFHAQASGVGLCLFYVKAGAVFADQ